MEPITTTIVAALVAGATAATKDVATTAIRDAYAGLKRLLSDRYERVIPLVEAVEADPASESEQQNLVNHLSHAEAETDNDLKNLAQQLLKAVEVLREVPKATALFDFDVLRAAGNFELTDIHSIGTVLRAREATFEKDVIIKGIHQKN